MERRHVEEVRTRGRSLTGYAARFGSEARIGNYTETIAHGAFRDSLGRDILALSDHDPAKVLARTKSGTLELREDDMGLFYNIQVPDTQAGRDVLALAERGDLGGMSFGFTAEDENWEGRKRELRKVRLHEISVVSAWPAYPETSVSARSKTPRRNARQMYLETLWRS